MRSLVWRRLILLALIMAIIIGSTGCQAGGQAAKSFQNFKDGFSNLQNKIGQALSNIFSSIGSVGQALIESIRNSVGGILGR